MPKKVTRKVTRKKTDEDSLDKAHDAFRIAIQNPDSFTREQVAQYLTLNKDIKSFNEKYVHDTSVEQEFKKLKALYDATKVYSMHVKQYAEYIIAYIDTPMETPVIHADRVDIRNTIEGVHKQYGNGKGVSKKVKKNALILLSRDHEMCMGLIHGLMQLANTRKYMQDMETLQTLLEAWMETEGFELHHLHVLELFFTAQLHYTPDYVQQELLPSTYVETLILKFNECKNPHKFKLIKFELEVLVKWYSDVLVKLINNEQINPKFLALLNEAAKQINVRPPTAYVDIRGGGVRAKKEVKTYNCKKYVVRTGARGGKYIVVDGKKKYI